MMSLSSAAKTLIAVTFLLALALMLFFALEKEAAAETEAPRLNPDGVEAFWGYSIDGRQVPCFTLVRNSGAAITCDWNAALIPPVEDEQPQ